MERQYTVVPAVESAPELVMNTRQWQLKFPNGDGLLFWRPRWGCILHMVRNVFVREYSRMNT